VSLILNGISPMKSSKNSGKVLLVVIVFLIYSSCSQPKKVEADSEFYHSILNRFYIQKGILIDSILSRNEFKPEVYKLNRIWDTIQEHKEPIIKYLLKYKEFRLGYSDKSLYYSELYERKKIPLVIGHLFESYHSLFLIEAIRVNDYLFNRKTNISNYYPPDEFSVIANIFRNDGINILLNVNDNLEEIFGESNHFNSIKFVNLKDERLLKNLDQGWQLYLIWVKNGMKENQNPIENSTLYWCDFNVLKQRSTKKEGFPNSEMTPLFDSLFSLVRISSNK
jgi:hypothetical protein